VILVTEEAIVEHQQPRRVCLKISAQDLGQEIQQVLDTAQELNWIRILAADAEIGDDTHEICTAKDVQTAALSILSIRRSQGVAVEGLSFGRLRRRTGPPVVGQQTRLQRMFS
jgi:hypothetical protein